MRRGKILDLHSQICPPHPVLFFRGLLRAGHAYLPPLIRRAKIYYKDKEKRKEIYWVRPEKKAYPLQAPRLLNFKHFKRTYFVDIEFWEEQVETSK